MKRENLKNYIELEAEHAKMNHLVEDGRWKVVRYKKYISIVPQSVNIRLMENILITVKDGQTNNETFLAWLREKMDVDKGKLLFAKVTAGSDDGEEEYPRYISTTTIVGDGYDREFCGGITQ